MLNQRETRSIPVDVIEVGPRRRMPSDTEIDQMVKSIEQDGLMMPIGVQSTGDNSYRLLHGATRLTAVKKLGWQEVPATILEGTPEDTAAAEIVENLTRRHLDKRQRDELTRAYTELRCEQRQNGSSKEFDDNPSLNSSPVPTSHPKMKVEGAKRGRPATPGGQANKEAACLTGRSVRTVQRATSTKPKGTTAADRDTRRLDALDGIKRPIGEIKRLLSASVLHDTDRKQMRQQQQPYLNGFIDEWGKLTFTTEAGAEKAGPDMIMADGEAEIEKSGVRLS